MYGIVSFQHTVLIPDSYSDKFDTIERNKNQKFSRNLDLGCRVNGPLEWYVGQTVALTWLERDLLQTSKRRSPP